MQEFEQIKSNIIDSLIMIPGIMGFANSKGTSPKSLSLKMRNKSISILAHENRYIIHLNLLVSFDVKTKDLCTKIDILIRNMFRKNKNTIESLNIYVRGVL